MKNVTDLFWAREQAREVGVCYRDARIPYADFFRRVRQAMANLHGHGVRQGSAVAIAVENPLGFLVLVLAVLRLGALVVPLPERLGRERRLHILGATRATHFVKDAEDALEPGGRLVLLEAARALSGAGGANTAPLLYSPSRRETPAFCAYTTGSTGMPKIIQFSQGQLGDALVATPDQGPPRVTMLCTELMSTYGFNNMARALISGSPLVLVDSADPETLVEAVAAHRVEKIIAMPGVVSALYSAVQMGKLPDAVEILRHVRLWRLAGARVPPQVMQWIRDGLAAELGVGYGATEIGSSVAVFAQSAYPSAPPELVGKVLDHVDVEVVDDEGRQVPPGASGHVRIRSPYMAQAYLNDPAATARNFCNGWFYPGDLGRLDANRLLYIQGRTDDQLNIGGCKVDALALEAQLCSDANILQACLVALPREDGPDTLACMVQVKDRNTREAVIEHVKTIMGAMGEVTQVLWVDAMAVNARGKLDRAALRLEARRQLGLVA